MGHTPARGGGGERRSGKGRREVGHTPARSMTADAHGRNPKEQGVILAKKTYRPGESPSRYRGHVICE